MARKAKAKVVRKGQRCKPGWERVTVKIGKRTHRICVRMDPKKKKSSKIAFILDALDTILR